VAGVVVVVAVAVEVVVGVVAILESGFKVDLLAGVTTIF
jgi:hypothetical protein